MTETPAPATGIDWNRLGQPVNDQVNGHVEARYVEGTGWHSPRFVRDPYLRIHGLSPSLNYGQEAYEGMKAHRSPTGNILLFRPASHAARLAKSAEFISIPPLPITLFKNCLHLAVWQNAEFVPPASSGAALYIRPVIIGLSPTLIPSTPTEYLFFIFVQPLAPYLGPGSLKALVLDEYDRAAPRGTGGVKLGGNYAPVIRWSAKAKREGFGILLHLDSGTRAAIDEFSTAAFMGIIEQAGRRVTLVISDSESIIESITADSAARIARELGWDVQRRVVKYSELRSFSEIIAAGTAAGLVPIRSITHQSQGAEFIFEAERNSKESLRCTQLSDILTGVMQGTLEDRYGWTEAVKETRALLA